MAKPIEGIPPFTGDAAKWLTDYLKRVKGDPAKQREIARRDKEIAKRVRPFEEAHR